MHPSFRGGHGSGRPDVAGPGIPSAVAALPAPGLRTPPPRVLLRVLPLRAPPSTRFWAVAIGLASRRRLPFAPVVGRHRGVGRAADPRSAALQSPKDCCAYPRPRSWQPRGPRSTRETVDWDTRAFAARSAWRHPSLIRIRRTAAPSRWSLTCAVSPPALHLHETARVFGFAVVDNPLTTASQAVETRATRRGQPAAERGQARIARGNAKTQDVAFE